MTNKCRFVASVLLFALLLFSLARGRILRAESFGELRLQPRALFATENSHTDSFMCVYCEPPNQCNGIVTWCPSGGGGGSSSPNATPSPSSTLNSTSSPSPSSTLSLSPSPTSTPSPNPSPSPSTTPRPRAPLPNLGEASRSNYVNPNTDEG